MEKDEAADVADVEASEVEAGNAADGDSGAEPGVGEADAGLSDDFRERAVRAGMDPALFEGVDPARAERLLAAAAAGQRSASGADGRRGESGGEDGPKDEFRLELTAEDRGELDPRVLRAIDGMASRLTDMARAERAREKARENGRWAELRFREVEKRGGDAAEARDTFARLAASGVDRETAADLALKAALYDRAAREGARSGREARRENHGASRPAGRPEKGSGGAASDGGGEESMFKAIRVKYPGA